LGAEKSLPCQTFDVVGDRGMVMIQVPRELPNADARGSAHLFNKGFLQRAERKVAPQGHVTVRIVPTMVTSSFRVDESLFLQHPEMVCSNAIPEADGVSDFCERRSRMSLDALVDQSADLPLQDLLPNKPRMLECHKRRRNENDKSGRDGRRRPGERRSPRPSYANGERRAAPC